MRGEVSCGGEFEDFVERGADELGGVNGQGAHAEAGDRSVGREQASGVRQVGQRRASGVAEQHDPAARGKQVEVGVDLFGTPDRPDGPSRR
jgi:hypothetical protein